MDTTGDVAGAQPRISLLNEKPLHAALKAWYAQAGDRVEVAVDGFLIDIVSGDLLVEIQTRNFAAVKRKLMRLVERHPVRLVYPIARQKWIVRTAEDGRRPLSRRRSPKHGIPADVFDELVSFPELLCCQNFSVELLLITEDEVRHHDGQRVWRRKGWAITERRLVKVVNRLLLQTPEDVAGLVPGTLSEPFTTADLARAIGRQRRLAQKMTYCLRAMGCLSTAGKQGNAVLYSRT